MISMIKDRIHKTIAKSSLKDAVETLEKEDVFWGEHFLIKRPVLQAIAPEDGKKQVLLIDEIDKTEKDAEALLLEVLSEFTISIPEYGTIQAKIKPVVVLTSNRTREITEGLRRRCVYLYLNYPDAATEKAILKLHFPDADETYIERVVCAVQQIRALPLKHIPAIAETIDVLRLMLAGEKQDSAWMHLLANHIQDYDAIAQLHIEL